ncbi:MAG: polysaccharide deacetylase family protein [Candidatus Rokuibacteriota bacterium]|nr:MAG: polysaccharide deacetylase family protein [Candidatus Rokubacteria bacterium]
MSSIAVRILRQIVYGMLVISGLPWLAARLNGPRSLILAYHGVHDGVVDPRLNFDGMHVRARRFARQMRYVARRYDVTTLDGLLDGAPAAGRSRPRAVITLDDGYRNVQRVAQPILRSLGLPATLFVPTDFVLRACGFWWDRLRVMVATAERPRVALPLDGAERTLSLRTLHEQKAALAQLSDELRRLPSPRRETALRSLATRLGVRASVDAGPLGERLSAAEVRALAEAGITESKWRLEEWTGRPVAWLAYPHGEFSAGVVEATRRAGYRGAVTTIEALNDGGQDRYALRRIGVHDNMTLPHFIVAVSGLHEFVVGLVAAVRRLAPRALRPWPRPAMPLPPTDVRAR